MLMFIQPVYAGDIFTTDDTLVCMNATKNFENKYKIKKHLLTTISSVETGRWNAERKQMYAWPWTINAQGKGTFFKTKKEAVLEVKRLQKAGVKSIDVGCMQINLFYHADAFSSVEDALDPKTNVEYGAKFLKSLYDRRGKNWIKAAMAYHSSVPHKALRYKKKLASAYEQVKHASNDFHASFTAQGSSVKAKPVVVKAKKPVVKAKSILAKAKPIVVKAKTPEEKRIAFNKARAWREVKISEYHMNR